MGGSRSPYPWTWSARLAVERVGKGDCQLYGHQGDSRRYDRDRGEDKGSALHPDGNGITFRDYR